MKKRKKIKKINEIEIFGERIKINYIEKEIDDITGEQKDPSCYGVAYFLDNEINIYMKHLSEKSNTFVELPTDKFNITFFHEILHVIFKLMGMKSLNKNERFVELLAQCLNQVIQQIEIKEVKEK